MNLRCPHCKNRIELVDDSEFSDVDCPSCGSRFNLAVDAATATFHQAGKQSIGHFRLLEKLGVGHFGTVWKARDTELDRTVAIKVPRKNQLDDSDRDLFLREARAAAQLRHPNIVSVHEVGRDDGTVYIASDYVQGASLQEWLTGQRPTSREAAELCYRIAGALHHAHEQGVVHRDLKPGNIMLDLEGEPHIMDFGLAKRDVGEITMTMDGQILGTPAYMSPEQARGEGHHADRRADIYSLGVMFYELLTGELPFRGTKRMLILQILSDEPTAPRRIDNGVPRDLETICLKCMEKDPAQRYTTAKDMADDLKSWLEGKPISARPVGQFSKCWRWCRRNPTVAGLATVAGMLILAVSVVSSVAWYREAELRRELQESDRGKTVALRTAERRRRESDLARQDAEKAKAKAIAAETAERKARIAESRVLHDSQLQLATTALRTAQTLWQQGHSEDALLWMARSLRNIPEDEKDVERIARTNYASCGSEFQPGRVLLRHPDRVTAIDVSPDSRTVLTGCNDGKARLWDLRSGRQLETVLDHGESIVAVGFGTDGKRIMIAGNSSLSHWDAGPKYEKRRQVREAVQSLPSTVHPPQFTLDRRRLVVYSIISQRPNIVLDVETGKPIGKGITGASTSLASTYFNADGTFAVRVNRNEQRQVFFEMVDVATGLPTGVATDPQPTLGPSAVCCFVPDTNLFLVVSFVGKCAYFDTTTGKQVGSEFLLPFSGNVVKACLSADGSRLLTADGDGVARSWDARTGRPLSPSYSRRAYLAAIKLSPDGEFALNALGTVVAVRGTVDPNEGYWQLPTGSRRFRLIGFSSDGSQLATASTMQTDASDGRPKTPGLRVWSTDGSGRFRDIKTSSLPRSVFFDSTAKGEQIAVLEGGRILDGATLSLRGIGELSVWDAKTLQPIRTTQLNIGPGPKAVVLDHETESLVVANATNTSRWSLASGERIDERVSAEFPFEPKLAAFSSRANTLFLAKGTEAAAWDVVNSTSAHSFRHPYSVSRLASSGDGRLLLTGGRISGDPFFRARFWNVETGELLADFKHYTRPRTDNRSRSSILVSGLAVSDDGSRILTSGGDVVRLWDARSRWLLAQLAMANAGFVAISPRGDHAAIVRSYSTANEMALWDIPRPASDSSEKLEAWAELVTGTRLTDSGTVVPLRWKEIQERRRRIQSLGGPPQFYERLKPTNQRNVEPGETDTARKTQSKH